MKLNVSAYYYYRDVYNGHFLKDEKKVVEKTDYHMFSAVAEFIDDSYDPKGKGNQGNQEAYFLRLLLGSMGSIVTTFEAFVDSIEKVMKQGATKADNSRNQLLFIKRLQSLMTLNALNVQMDDETKEFEASFKMELNNFPEEIKTMDGMKRLFAKFLVEVDGAHKKWYKSPIIDFTRDEMFPKNGGSKNEAPKGKTPDSKGKTPDSKGKTDRPASPAAKKK